MSTPTTARQIEQVRASCVSIEVRLNRPQYEALAAFLGHCRGMLESRVLSCRGHDPDDLKSAIDQLLTHVNDPAFD